MERLTIADDKHTVVQSSTAGRVKDAAGVQLEFALVGLNGHADGLVGSRLRDHGRHQTVHDRTQAIPDGMGVPRRPQASMWWHMRVCRRRMSFQQAEAQSSAVYTCTGSALTSPVPGSPRHRKQAAAECA